MSILPQITLVVDKSYVLIKMQLCRNTQSGLALSCKILKLHIRTKWHLKRPFCPPTLTLTLTKFDVLMLHMARNVQFEVGIVSSADFVDFSF